jgi:hypothetical protein
MWDSGREGKEGEGKAKMVENEKSNVYLEGVEWRRVNMVLRYQLTSLGG